MTTLRKSNRGLISGRDFDNFVQSECGINPVGTEGSLSKVTLSVGSRIARANRSYFFEQKSVLTNVGL
jgi:hypothetical protein